MINKSIIVGILLLTLQNSIVAQSKTNTFFKNSDYEVMLTTEPFGSSVGILRKISKRFLDKNHFEGTFGAAEQDSYTFKTKFEKNMGSDTRTVDKSLFLTQDWRYFPFQKKSLMLEVGLYGGVTRSVAQGSLSLPQYDIKEEYHDRYFYFNYGSVQSLAWNFKTHYQVGLFSMLSLKGILDSGRARPAEVDSRFFVGLKFGYRFK